MTTTTTTYSVLAAELAGRTEARRPGRWLWEAFSVATGTSRNEEIAQRNAARAAARAARMSGGPPPWTTVLPCAAIVRECPAAHAAYLAAGGDTDRRILDEEAEAEAEDGEEKRLERAYYTGDLMPVYSQNCLLAGQVVTDDALVEYFHHLSSPDLEWLDRDDARLWATSAATDANAVFRRRAGRNALAAFGEDTEDECEGKDR